jgi:ABC-type transport system involved in multi-copper enzyme maturation permease subunit
MIKILIPKYITEKMALFYGLILSAVQTFLNGICSSEWELYIVSVVFFLGIIHFPAIKAIIVNESIKTKQGSNYQANLQGAISSIRTASMSVGSLLFSSLFSIGISMKPYPIPSLPFIAGSLIYLAAYLYLQSDTATEIEEVEEKNVGFTLNVAEGGLGGEEPEFFQ